MMGNALSAQEVGFDPERLERLRAAIDSDIAAEKYDGAAIAVARHGRLALFDHRGYAERAARRPLSEDTAFISMSIGKQFVNALVLSYVERGLLALHAPVGEVLPEFAGRGKERITLFHLLTHTSGLMGAIPPLPAKQLVSIEQLAAYAAQSVPESLPGERVNYSIILAHAVLAQMVLRVNGNGRSFGEILDEEVFRPLGMKDTSLGVRADLRERVAPVVARFSEPGRSTPRESEGLGRLLMIEGAEVPAGG